MYKWLPGVVQNMTLNNMIKEEVQVAQYKLVYPELHFEYLFPDKQSAENAENYLDSLMRVLQYMEISLEKNIVHLTVLPFSTSPVVEFTGISSIYHLDPDYEGHHPNGMTESIYIDKWTIFKRLLRKALCEKVKCECDYPNTFYKFMEVSDDLEKIFPKNLKLNALRYAHNIRIGTIDII